MARRTPFPFRDHHDPEVHPDQINGLVTTYIEFYESALADEYMSGDIDTASYNEGMRTAYEGVLVDLLGIEADLLDAYWKRGPHAEPPTYELPYTGGNQLISYERVEAWTGRRLNAEQWEALDEAVGKSAAPLIRGLVDRIAE
jgi:hypothetical protein